MSLREHRRKSTTGIIRGRPLHLRHPAGHLQKAFLASSSGDLFHEIGQLQAFITQVRALQVSNPALALEKINETIMFRDKPQIMTIEGRILSDAGRYEEARNVFERFVEMHPYDVRARMSLARLYLRTFEVNRAREQYQFILDENKHDIPARRELADLECERRNYDVARQHVDCLLKVLPHDLSGRVTLGKIELRTHNIGAATAIFEAVARDNPKDRYVANVLESLQNGTGPNGGGLRSRQYHR